MMPTWTRRSVTPAARRDPQFYVTGCKPLRDDLNDALHIAACAPAGDRRDVLAAACPDIDPDRVLRILESRPAPEDLRLFLASQALEGGNRGDR